MKCTFFFCSYGICSCGISCVYNFAATNFSKTLPPKKKEEYGLFFTAWAPHDFSTNHLSHLGVKSRPLVLPNLRAPFIQLRRMKLVETEM